MTIDQERVSDVSTDHTCIVYIDIIDIVNDVNPFALRTVSWLDNPNVLFAVMLLKFLIVRVEVSKFIREDVGIWNEVKVLLPVSLLHPNHVKAQSIFPCNLI